MMYEGLTIISHEPSLAQLDRWLEHEVACRKTLCPPPRSPRKKRPPRQRACVAKVCESLCPGCGELFSFITRGGARKKFCGRRCASRVWDFENIERRRQQWRAHEQRRPKRKRVRGKER